MRAPRASCGPSATLPSLGGLLCPTLDNRAHNRCSTFAARCNTHIIGEQGQAAVSAGLSPKTVGRGAVNTSTTRSCSPDTELVWACTNEGPTPRPEKSPSNKASVTPVSVSTHKLGAPSFMIGPAASSTPEVPAPVSPGPVSVCDTPAPAPAPAAPAVTPPPSPDSAATQGMAAVARHRVPDNARVGMESGATGTEKVVPLHAPPYGDSTDRHRANRAPPLCMHGVAKSRVRSTTKRVAGIGSRMLPPMRRSFPADSSSARISATLVPTRVAVRPAANVCPATCRNQPVNNNASATVDNAQRQTQTTVYLDMEMANCIRNAVRQQLR